MSKEFVVPAAVSSWSGREVQRLRTLADACTSVRDIAKLLCRTESAIRNRAAHHGISLRGLMGAATPA
ncbi:hypothetical protein [Povalibacter sp.]|uniref:hypothetical protein n=1 Tax=Povalibacter sp. TaxID=1962978 RepID=UPI002F3F0FAF